MAKPNHTTWNPDPAEADARERRVYERVPFFRPVLIAVPPDSEGFEARSFDISLGGVGLVCVGGPELWHGASVALMFRLSDPRHGPIVERVAGRVAYKKSEGIAFRVGVEFEAPVHPRTHPGLSRVIERL